MASTSTLTSPSSSLLSTSARTENGVTHIDLAFSAEMSKGGGSIFVTDGAIQTVIDRVTGQPKLRVVGATFTREVTLDAVQLSGNHVMFDAAGLPPGAELNIYMGAGTLVGGNKAFAGITLPGSAAFTTPAVVVEPPPLPTLGASIAFETTTLKAGGEILGVVTFSHPVGELGDAAFTAEHATVEVTGRSEDGLSWEFKLIPQGSVDAPASLLRLDLAQAFTPQDLVRSGTVTSPPYAVDTVVDAWVELDMVGYDIGEFESDGITADDRQVLRGTLHGTLEDGERIELVINGRSVDASKIVIDNLDGLLVWEYDSDSERNGDEPPIAFAHGDNTVEVRVVNVGGHSSTGAFASIIVDTTRPDVTGSPHGAAAFSPSDDIVISFSEAVYWHDGDGSGAMLVLRDGDDEFHHIAIDRSNFSSDGRTLTVSAAALGLVSSTDYGIILPTTLADLAGNPLGEYQINFRTGDETPPRTVRFSVDDDGSFRAGETLTFRVRFNEAIMKTDDAYPSLVLSNGGRAEFVRIDGNEAVFAYTVEAGDDADHVTIDDTSELPGHFADLSGNVLDGAHIVFEGLYDGSGYGAHIDIDTVVPDAPGAPKLHPNSNSGSADDVLTSDRTPTLTGTGAEAYAKVEIVEGDTLLGYGYADEGGNWEATVNTAMALADGAHQLTIRQVDDAGNRSLASEVLAVTIDTLVATLAAPMLAEGDDTGSSITDNITRQNAPTLVGSGAEAGASIQVLFGGEVVGLGYADEHGHWSAELDDELDDGQHEFTVRQEDDAGNLGAESAPLWFTVDRTPPKPPPAPQLAAASNSGAPGDNITSVRTPTFTGVADADTEVVLYANEHEVGRTLTDGSGNWSISVDSDDAFDDGLYGMQLQQVDIAGNKSGYSDGFDLRVDTTAAAPERPLLAASSDTGASNSDGITSDTTPLFTGTGAEAGAAIVLFAGTREIGRTNADGAGQWSLEVSETNKFTADGAYAVTAQQIDKAGNTSTASNAFDLVIDTAGPTLLGFDSSLLKREFQLKFSETIRFDPSGQFDLKLKLTDALLGNFKGNSHGNWYTSDSVAGGENSVLNFKISLTGLYNITMNNDAIQDLAGNVAVITGSRQWFIDLLDGLSS
jgi:hypothetical protein